LEDKKSRVRQACVRGLNSFKDPALAGLYVNLIKADQSYFVVAEAARALGQSGAPQAYEVLVDLLRQDSWQDMTRAAALSGLAALKDVRALDLGFKYAAAGNPTGLRLPALQLLGEVGKGNDRALEVLTVNLKDKSRQILFGSVRSLVALGDPRSIPAMEAIVKDEGQPQDVRASLADAVAQIKNGKK
jgi:aminopeptidase N